MMMMMMKATRLYVRFAQRPRVKGQDVSDRCAQRGSPPLGDTRDQVSSNWALDSFFKNVTLAKATVSEGSASSEGSCVSQRIWDSCGGFCRAVGADESLSLSLFGDFVRAWVESGRISRERW